ncbi:FecR family protein [Chitinophaga sp. RCC_12]|uniref:FecR family protein n=1 Tax=Chitinophaga sp. RCC_12 TaxID=3239226 RepID=UPI00352431B8
MIQEDHIKQLLERYINDLSTEEERLQLLDIIDSRPEIDWYALLAPAFTDAVADKTFTPEKWQPVLDSILKYPQAEKKTRVVPLFRRWWSVAAMLAILLGAGWWFYRAGNAKVSPPVIAMADVPPGSNRAVLKLANGQEITLDSAHGNIVQHGNFKVNNDSGMLNYEGKANVAEYHTLSTPRGGQYKLQLPDGTNVWLNAASSITYPTVFTGRKREVAITGEAYFEVAKDPGKPFNVQVNQMNIAVLGTHFNVNAYNDEPDAKTTLLEGAVKVNAGNQVKILAPGQQALLEKNNTLRLIEQVNVEDVIAWKNGYTVFENADIQTIMRQVSRWYNVDVVFEGNIPQRQFAGGISRKSSLAELLKVLEFANVNFVVEGKKIVVKP